MLLCDDALMCVETNVAAFIVDIVLQMKCFFLQALLMISFDCVLLFKISA